MADYQRSMQNFKPGHDFLVAFDSDGCVFDTMEIKQKECFIPNTIKYWSLQPISKYVRSASEFVNLYSKWRGANRFPALIKVFDLLREWPEVQKRKVEIPLVQPLCNWVQRESRLGNPALADEVKRTGDTVLNRALAWSRAVNAAVEDMVHGIPPFPLVRESLEKIASWADIIVCSGTPGEALRREWEKHGIAGFPRFIAGQEAGSKKEHLELVTNEYPEGHVVMIGDSPADLEATKANNLLFYPINPGQEEDSWELLYTEGLEKFRSGDYSSEYEAKLIAGFVQRLPEIPPWEKPM